MPLWMYFVHPIMVVTFFYQERYSAGWDKELNRLMDADPTPEVSMYTAIFRVDGKKYEVWIANRYYSYGHIYWVDGINAPKQVRNRPSFRTMCRLAKLVGNQNRAIEKKEVADFLQASGFRK